MENGPRKHILVADSKGKQLRRNPTFHRLSF